MSPGRLSVGERIAGISAVMLFISMFFDWFGSKDSGEVRLFSVGRSAWEALDYIPIVLVIAVVVTVAIVALRLTDVIGGYSTPAGAAVAIFGFVSVFLIIFRIIFPPNFGAFREIWGTITIEGTIHLPIFVALLAAAGIAFGGCLSMWEEGTRVAGLGAGRHKKTASGGFRNIVKAN